MTTRRWMLAVAIAALLLWPVHCIRRKPYDDWKGQEHSAIAHFCKEEETRMRMRADACADRARRGVAWDDPSEAADDLKCCPYSNDVPRYGSWAEQSAIWERAATRAREAAEWHSRLADYYFGWSPIAPRRP